MKLRNKTNAAHNLFPWHHVAAIESKEYLLFILCARSKLVRDSLHKKGSTKVGRGRQVVKKFAYCLNISLPIFNGKPLPWFSQTWCLGRGQQHSLPYIVSMSTILNSFILCCCRSHLNVTYIPTDRHLMYRNQSAWLPLFWYLVSFVDFIELFS